MSAKSVRQFRTRYDYGLFANRVVGNTRYRYNSEDEDFLRTVEEAGLRKTEILEQGKTLYRAQLGNEPRQIIPGNSFEVAYPFQPARMVPLQRSAKEGRVNSKGIPCLYLADRESTALAEVRPWIGAPVSLGYFRTIRELRLVDCTAPRSGFTVSDIADLNDIYQMGMKISPPESEEPTLEERVWGEISSAFSQPVTDSDIRADYAPTQVLAEVFQRIGCDGIKYRSLLGDGGTSFALFNISDATIFRCCVYQTETIQHSFSVIGQSYEVSPDEVIIDSPAAPVMDDVDEDIPALTVGPRPCAIVSA